MAISAQEGDDVFLLNGWQDQEVRALAEVRAAAARMQAQLATGVGCDPTQVIANATNCRRFGKVTFASWVEGFQNTWNANYQSFVTRITDSGVGWVKMGVNPDIDEVLTQGLEVDGEYGLKTATAQLLINKWPAGFPPPCGCQMRDWVNSPEGQAGLAFLQLPVVNQLEPAPAPPEPAPPEPQQPQQPQIQIQQPAQIAGTTKRETSPAVYWGIGLLVLAAAGGTWYYMRGRKGRRR